MEVTIQSPKINLGGRSIDPFPIWIGILIVGLILGGIGAAQVLINGLQVTGLSDQVPWGLWITIDLSSIALGGGAFVMGVIVYLLRVKSMENIGKLGVLIGFLGYSSAGIILLMDLGRPDRFWHPVVFWQPHSLLWEITMCVVLYLTVLALEMVPTIFEHPLFDRFPFLAKVIHFIHKIGPILAIAGMSLSLLHQASLGATYGVLSGRGLWFRPTAPVMFIISAVGGGLALTFLASLLIFRKMRPGLVAEKTFYTLAQISGYALLAYLYMKLWDWAVTYYYSFDVLVNAQVQVLDSIAPYSWSFWVGEVLMGALLPAIVLISGPRHKNLRLMIVAAIAAVIGTVILRWNYNLSGLVAYITYDPFTPTVEVASYTPTWQEYFVGTGVISYWLLAFSLAARFLPFHSRGGHGDHVDHAEHAAPEAPAAPAH